MSSENAEHLAPVPQPAEHRGVLGRLGRYVLVEELGRGGMGVVYAAYDPAISREVALKTIAFDHVASGLEAEILRRSLLSEARSAGKLIHPAIVSIFDVGEDQGYGYVVMEKVNGSDLSKVVRQVRLSPAEILRILAQIADAVDFAHAQGIIHRDIKPANILIDNKRCVKLTDFGIAKAGTPELTGYTVNVLGTPRYMSPEQTQPGKLTGKSDQYSLAIVAYELLTGTVPFSRLTSESGLRRIRAGFRPSAHAANSELDPAIDPVFARALAIQPEHRFPDCKTFIEELQKSFPRKPLSTDFGAVRKIFLSRKIRFIGPLLACLLLLIGGLWTALRMGSWNPRAPAPKISLANSSQLPAHTESMVVPPMRPPALPNVQEKQPLAFPHTPEPDPSPLPLVRRSAPSSSRFYRSASPDQVLTPEQLVARGKDAYRGQTGSIDPSKAAYLFKKAAEAGNTEAATLLGTMYTQGIGIQRDYGEAVRLFTKAAEAGNPRAMDNLAHLYAGGYGVTKSLGEAARWYTKASDLGDPDATYHLGGLYDRGDGVPADPEKARALYTRAAQFGDKKAALRLSLLAERRIQMASRGILRIDTIEPAIVMKGLNRLYRLHGSGLSPSCVINAAGASFIGSKSSRNRFVQTAPDGSWADIYIYIDSRATLHSMQMVVETLTQKSTFQILVLK